MRTQRLNDEERRQWVLNDESLYRWHRAEQITLHRTLHRFIRLNRVRIDEHIKAIRDAAPAHA